MPAEHAGRKGRPWRRLREQVRRTESVCASCGKPFDPAFQFPHPMSFSVDHIEPVSLRPELAMERTNLQAMHLGCNSSKGNGAARTQVATSRDW